MNSPKILSLNITSVQTTLQNYIHSNCEDTSSRYFANEIRLNLLNCDWQLRNSKLFVHQSSQI
jgi:hypothetical protein